MARGARKPIVVLADVSTPNGPMSVPLARFVYEAGMLKRLPRAGWSLLGIPQPESVAEHVYRTAVIGYCLAQIEGRDADRTAALCLFHDLAEARTGDHHALAKRQGIAAGAEAAAWSSLTGGLPPELGRRLAELRSEYAADASPEAQLAHDADRLECLVQAREYESAGITGTEAFVAGVLAGLRSRAARALARSCLETAPDEWWRRALDGGADGAD